MTIGQCIEKIEKLISYFSVAGNRVSQTDGAAADYRYRAVSFIDTAQKELCIHFPVAKTATMSQRRYKNLLPDSTIVDVGGGAVYGVSGGTALTFQTDACVKVTVQYWQETVPETEDSPAIPEGWVQCASLTTQNAPTFTPYILRFDKKDRQEIRFEAAEPGKYAYVSGAAVYNEPFASDGDVPPWRSFRSHPLPKDFCRFDEVVFTPTPRSMQPKPIPYALGYDTLDVARDFDGTILLVYRAMCPSVNEMTPSDTVLSLPEHVAELIPYYAAALLVAEENPGLSQELMSLYHTKLLNLDAAAVVTHVQNELYRGGVNGAI